MILSRPIGDHIQMQIKTKKQSHAQLTYIQQRDCVVDRINLSGSQVIIGGFLLLQNFCVAISVSPHVCFILVLILISMFLR